jgi:hypothetical protein
MVPPVVAESCDCKDWIVASKLLIWACMVAALEVCAFAITGATAKPRAKANPAKPVTNFVIFDFDKLINVNRSSPALLLNIERKENLGNNALIIRTISSDTFTQHSIYLISYK